MLNISSLSCIFQTFSILTCFSVTWLNAKYQYFDIKAVVWILTHRGRTCRWTLTLADLTMMMRSVKLYSLDIWNLTRNRTATLKFCLLFSELLLDSCPGDFPAHTEKCLWYKKGQTGERLLNMQLWMVKPVELEGRVLCTGDKLLSTDRWEGSL